MLLSLSLSLTHTPTLSSMSHSYVCDDIIPDDNLPPVVRGMRSDLQAVLVYACCSLPPSLSLTLISTLASSFM
jgi:hypothetical protein